MPTSRQTEPDPDAEHDHERMRRVAAGEMAAFDELVIRYQKRAWAVAWRILGDSAEAEDAVQEAFLRILRAAARYRPEAPFSTFLFRVVTRVCLDARAKKKPEYAADVPESSHSETPEAALQRRQRTEAVHRALARLPRRHRAAIALRHDEELSYEEIGRALGISPKAVDSLLQRARQSLRGLLREAA